MNRPCMILPDRGWKITLQNMLFSGSMLIDQCLYIYIYIYKQSFYDCVTVVCAKKRLSEVQPHCAASVPPARGQHIADHSAHGEVELPLEHRMIMYQYVFLHYYLYIYIYTYMRASSSFFNVFLHVIL